MLPRVPGISPACAALSNRFPVPLQAGDKVVYSKYAGTEVELQGDSYVLLKVRAGGEASGAGRVVWPDGWPAPTGLTRSPWGSNKACSLCGELDAWEQRRS